MFGFRPSTAAFAQSSFTLDATSGTSTISTNYTTTGGHTLNMGFFAEYLVLAGGGGGGGNNGAGGRGGSSLVVVRYQGASLGNIGGSVTSGSGSAGGSIAQSRTTLVVGGNLSGDASANGLNGSLVIDGGNVSARNVYIAHSRTSSRSSTGVLTVASGTLSAAGDLGVGTAPVPDSGGSSWFITGSAALNVLNGGVVDVRGVFISSTNASVVVNAGGALKVGGRVLRTTGPSAAINDGTIIFDGTNAQSLAGSITGTGAVVKSGGLLSVDGAFVAGIVKLSGGTSTVNAVNTYTGQTWVRQGTLATGLANAFSGSSSLVVDSGATLDRAGFSQTVTNADINGTVGNTGGSGLLTVTGTLSGSGLLNGDVTVTGFHAPGNSPGVQTFDGNLSYANGASIGWGLTDNTTSNSPVVFDQIVLSGTSNLTFSGSNVLALSFASPGSLVDWTNSFWNVNRAWTVNAGGPTGTHGRSARPGRIPRVGDTGPHVGRALK